jgi:hypothetical protein
MASIALASAEATTALEPGTASQPDFQRPQHLLVLLGMDEVLFPRTWGMAFPAVSQRG